MEVSAGIAIIYDNKILLVHPTKSGRQMWGIPKGKVEINEDLKETASRETNEEIGIHIDPQYLNNAKEIRYKNKRTKKIYKKVYYFIYYAKSLQDLGIDNLVIDKSKLSLREVDRARFMNLKEAETLIFWRQKEILKYLT